MTSAPARIWSHHGCIFARNHAPGPVPSKETMPTFHDLGLSQTSLDALTRKGFAEPTPIQAKTIPMLLGGEVDIVGQAMTGTGKTAAFALPIIERAREDAGRVQALVLAPTRELAVQVSDEINSLRGGKRLRVLPVYGGQPIGLQLRSLKRGVDVAVGTPGRILDHLERGSLDISGVSFFVLDEADEMCNMGFIDDVRAILAAAGTERRTLMFSATMPRAVMRIAEEFMGDYQVVSVRPPAGETPLTRQIFHETSDSDRFEALCRVIDAEQDFYGLVFCRTRADTDQLAERLADRGYPAEPIHGDLSQSRREEILGRFRKGRITILAATDVAARGIDVPDLTHVVNYSLPQDPETYVHRIGRTGRAGKRGAAVTLIGPREFRRLMYIAKSNGFTIEKKKLPRIEDVIHSKKTRICNALDEILVEGGHEAYLSMAGDILAEKDAEDVVAALLRLSFGDELDRKSYREIRDMDREGGDRVTLSVEMGRSQGLNPRKLVSFLCRRAGVKPFSIQNVKVFGQYSVFTAPGRDADAVLRALNKRSKTADGRPFARRRTAKPPKKPAKFRDSPPTKS